MVFQGRNEPLEGFRKSAIRKAIFDTSRAIKDLAFRPWREPKWLAHRSRAATDFAGLDLENFTQCTERIEGQRIGAAHPDLRPKL